MLANASQVFADLINHAEHSALTVTESSEVLNQVLLIAYGQATAVEHASYEQLLGLLAAG